MLHKLRRRVQDEKGFTLIELLVVILIIGILAAIAIPSFINQKGKGQDAAAKSWARTAATAEETYFTDNNAYTTTLSDLTTIEPTLSQFPDPANTPTIDAVGGPYHITVKSKSGGTYQYTRTSGGNVLRACSGGGCPTSGSW